MNNNITPISFQGRININSFREKAFSGGEWLPEFITTKEQDLKIKTLVEEIARKDERTETFPDYLETEKANRLYDLLGKIMGKPLRNVENQKAIHYDGEIVTFGDRNPQYCGGEIVYIDFRA